VAAVVEKDCLCEGLGASALLKEGMRPAHKLEAVAICPGPNTAYFNSVVSLRTMVDHIYGRIDLLANVKRPHMFMKELMLYVEYLKRELQQVPGTATIKQQRYLTTFRANLNDGMNYYRQLIPALVQSKAADCAAFLADLERLRTAVQELVLPEEVVA